MVNTGDRYIRQRNDIPLSGAEVVVHNVFLSYFAEVGVIGAEPVDGGVWQCASCCRSSPTASGMEGGDRALCLRCCLDSRWAVTHRMELFGFAIMVLWTMAGILNAEHEKKRGTVPRAGVVVGV